MTSSPAPPSAVPYLVHGYSAAKKTGRLAAFAALPNQRAVTLRNTVTFRPGRPSRDEAYVAQMVGDVQVGNSACAHCTQGNGPFSLCVTVEGHFGEACANCAYQSEAVRCSIRINYENAVAQLSANATAAPVIPNMAPANNFGSSLSSASPSTPAPALASPLLRRSPRRVAVTTVGPVGMDRAAALAARVAATPALPAANAPNRLRGIIDGFNGLTDAELRNCRALRLADIAELELELAAIRFVEARRASH